MKYFRFKNNSEGSIVGCYPQCQMSRKFNPTAPKGAFNLHPFELPDYQPEMEFILEKKAKWTDMVSTIAPGFGFVINEKVKKIFEEFMLPPHVFYPINICSKKEVRLYYWFHFVTTGFWDWVDREQSVLSLRSILPNERSKIIETVNLFEKDEEITKILRKRRPLKAYYWDQLVLHANFPKYDLFEEPATYTTLASERLVAALEAAQVSGYSVRPFNLIVG